MKKEIIKIVQCDKRGQIVIPKKIRLELGIEEGAGFWIYKKEDEIILKKIEGPSIKVKTKK